MKKTIKSWRKAADMTQVSMARSLGINPHTYAKYENKPERMPLGMVTKILEILDITIDNIFLSSNFSVGEIENE